MSIALFILSLLLALFTAIPLIRYERWWIRIFDFPRLQVATLSLLVLVALFFVWPEPWLFLATLVLAGFALIVQSIYILPYTPLWPKETVDAKGGHPTLRLLMANVLMENREAKGLFDFINREKPDIISLDEPDSWWEEQFRAIEKDYPHTMKDARPNTYGMLLYSRIPFYEQDHRCIIEDEVPSFHVCLAVAEQRVRLHFIHPKPPFPKEAKSTTGRDAELIVVGRLAAMENDPVIVAGDLNDVAWSHTTRLFQRVSGLLDPRRGRGMFNTFHADHFLARWPLDHLFHSEHFRLARIERGPAYGSDHFPILVELELDLDAQREQDAPELSASDAEEANEKVTDAAAKPDPDA